MLQPLVFYGAYSYNRFLFSSWSVVLTALHPTPGGKASDPVIEYEARLEVSDTGDGMATLESSCLQLPAFRSSQGYWRLWYAEADSTSSRKWTDCLVKTVAPAASATASVSIAKLCLDLPLPGPDDDTILVRAVYTFTNDGKHREHVRCVWG